MVKLRLKNICKHYKNFDVKNVSFEVPDGVVVGLIGENGAGKSTIIKSILGAVHPDSGEILFNGIHTDKLTDEQRQRISFVFDDVALPIDLDMTALNIVLSKIYRNWYGKKFRSLLEQFNLPQDKPFGAFSKGMKMKAALAVAFSHDSELLILDEPTSGLDPVVRDEILSLLYDYNQQGDRSVLLSSHITSDLEKICDYIVYIHNGKVVFSEEKDTLLRKYSVYSLTDEQLKEIPAHAIVRVLRRNYGTDILALRKNMPETFVSKNITLDDIMLFYCKGETI